MLNHLEDFGFFRPVLYDFSQFCVSGLALTIVVNFAVGRSI